jgi:ABC-type Zn uptake system ZnuABC Zn-binding protein ZnuA
LRSRWVRAGAVLPARAASAVLPTLLAGMVLLVLVVASMSGCGGGGDVAGAAEQALILADTSFLADITQNVAGDRFSVSSLVPLGADPHTFEATPQDAQRVAECRALVINVTGLMPVVDELAAGAGGPGMLVIEAAAGLPDAKEDPHFWLDPMGVITYVDNIANGLATVDPVGMEVYLANAEAYKVELRELDAWIVAQVATIPAERRLLVTNHASFGRFAARYGFEIVGTVFQTTTGEGSPSARQLASLVESIRTTGAPAIFLETGSSPDLAEQVAAESGVEVVSDLYTHSLGEGAPTYLDMMRWNVTRIVEALR